MQHLTKHPGFDLPPRPSPDAGSVALWVVVMALSVAGGSVAAVLYHFLTKGSP